MEKYEISTTNSLKDEIEELLQLCEKKETDGELGKTYFEDGISEKELSDWEEKNGVKIPESYKEWLRFTKECRIDGNTATFWGPDKFHSNYVPEDLIVIGEMVGDGEVVCFSKENGDFSTFFEGKGKKLNTFTAIVNDVISVLGNKPNLSDEEFFEILAKYEAMKKSGEI